MIIALYILEFVQLLNLKSGAPHKSEKAFNNDAG